MCRNISIMLLVLFAVILGLPASKGEGSAINFLECYRAVYVGGNIFCQQSGYGKFKSLDYETCEVECEGGNVELPDEACSSGVHNGCTQALKNSLLKWSTDMKKGKDRLKKI
uniref:Putative ixodes 10 kDa peptide protein n=1 Tax=Ixodes ricinus TaxID=34613 RepID=A0A0K8RCA4_IXORI